MVKQENGTIMWEEGETGKRKGIQDTRKGLIQQFVVASPRPTHD